MSKKTLRELIRLLYQENDRLRAQVRQLQPASDIPFVPEDSY